MKKQMTDNQQLPLDFAIGQAGSLEQYIASVNAYPLLSIEEEVSLAHRFRVEHDLHAVSILVMSHLRFVVAVARSYLGYGLQHADLIQEGNIGLMKAIKRFDETRGVRLVTFALHWIKAEIHDFILKNWKLVRAVTTKAKRKLFFKLRSMRSMQTLTYSEAEEIAQSLDVSVKDVVDMEHNLQPDTHLDAPLKQEASGNDNLALIDTLPCIRHDPSTIYEETQEARLHATCLKEAISTLDERAQNILRARWLSDSPESLQSLSQRYGVSMERIRQIEKASLKKIRQHFEQNNLLSA